MLNGVSGIYTITSPSGGLYVGSAVDLGGRIRVHRHLLKRGKHFNRALQRACAKYGMDRIIFRVLLICRPADLVFYEQRAIEVLKPRYNACPTAGSQLGRRHRPESNEKNRRAHLGRKTHTAEWKASLSNRMKGNRLATGISPTIETRAKLSAALKGVPKRYKTKLAHARLAAAYLGGKGLRDLAAEERADHRTIRRALVAAGVSIRPRYVTIRSRSA